LDLSLKDDFVRELRVGLVPPHIDRHIAVAVASRSNENALRGGDDPLLAGLGHRKVRGAVGLDDDLCVEGRDLDGAKECPHRVTVAQQNGASENSLFTRNRLLVGPIDLLGQPDQESFGPSDVAEPIRVFVLDHLAADKLCAVLEEPGEHFVDVVDREHDA
jgi:hypothetical protein